MIRRLILAAALVLPTTGCAAGIYTGFSELHPAAAPVLAERVAVLPVTAAEGSEHLRGVIGDSLLRQAALAHPQVKWIPTARSLDLLNDAGLAERFASMLVAHQQTGIYDRALLRDVGRALQADHVLQLRIGYARSEQLTPYLLDSDDAFMAEKQEMFVTAVLWDVREGGLAWEASGSTTSEEGQFTSRRQFGEVVGAAAAQLARQLPIAAPSAEAVEAADAGGH
jgi:hypothetical protein